jgi:uncharacterized membrane protein
MNEKKIFFILRLVQKRKIMASKKLPVEKKSKSNRLEPLFGKENYTWMLIGIAVIALGMFLMSGGKNQDPNTFDYKTVYSTMRVTIAPIVILIGFGIEIFAIFKKSKDVSSENK